jgi:hypothetical protein
MKSATVVVIGLLTTLRFTSARAGDHPPTLPGWQPAPFSGFTLPAGTFCPFALKAEVLRNDAIVATTKSFADGTPEQQVYMGPQLYRFSNIDTGASVLTLLDGILIYDFASDGSFTITAIGKNGLGFRPIDGFPAGLYLVDGYHVVRYGANGGPRQMLSAIGIETSYCQTLGHHQHD